MLDFEDWMDTIEDINADMKRLRRNILKKLNEITLEEKRANPQLEIDIKHLCCLLNDVEDHGLYIIENLEKKL